MIYDILILYIYIITWYHKTYYYRYISIYHFFNEIAILIVLSISKINNILV